VSALNLWPLFLTLATVISLAAAPLWPKNGWLFLAVALALGFQHPP